MQYISVSTHPDPCILPFDKLLICRKFIKNVHILCLQVQQVQEESAKLIVAYSGDKAIEIQDREAEVVNAWRNLQVRVDIRKNSLGDAGDLYRFFNMVRDLLLWMKDMNVQMSTQEKPRCVTAITIRIIISAL